MRLVFLLMAVSLTVAAHADWFARTPQEDAMCRARIYAGHDTSDIDNWRHMHHYCDCIRFINRAYLANDRSDRQHALSVGIDGCNYVLRATKPDFYMRPEIMTEKAIGQRMLGQKTQAADELLKAIQFNPDYAPAYAELSDYYREIGDKKMALQMATEGLKRQPDSRKLRRLYSETGGKLPYPEPIVKMESAEQAAASPQAKAVPETGVNKQTDIGKQTSTPDISSPEPAATAPGEPKIGSPSDPYCRFCPPQ